MTTNSYTSDLNLGKPKFFTLTNILLVNNNTISKYKYRVKLVSTIF